MEIIGGIHKAHRAGICFPKYFQLRVAALDIERGGDNGGVYIKAILLKGEEKRSEENIKCNHGDHIDINWRFIQDFEWDDHRSTYKIKDSENVDEPKVQIRMKKTQPGLSNEFIGKMTLNLLDIEKDCVKISSEQYTMVRRDCLLSIIVKYVIHAFNEVRKWIPGLKKTLIAKKYEDSPSDKKKVSLFDIEHINGYWPLLLADGETAWDSDVEKASTKDRRVHGYIHLDIRLVHAGRAEERRVGKGRKAPNRDPFLKEPKHTSNKTKDKFFSVFECLFANSFGRFWKLIKPFILHGLLLLFILLIVIIITVNLIMKVPIWKFFTMMLPF